MEYEKVLSGISDEDVITIINHNGNNTFCVSEFREVFSTAITAIEKAYCLSIEEQGYDLSTGFEFGHRNFPSYSEWFNAGADCNMLRLGNSKWTHGKIRIRVEVEFVPEEEVPKEHSDEANKSALDEIRNSIEPNN